MPYVLYVDGLAELQWYVSCMLCLHYVFTLLVYAIYFARHVYFMGLHAQFGHFVIYHAYLTLKAA